MEPAAAVTPLNPAARNHDGAYRLVWDAWRRYRRGFAFDWSASSALFTLSSRETWRLYEVWCFLSVASALRESGWRCADADGLALLRGGLSFSLAPGSASRMVFARGAERVTLTYARRIPRAGQGVQRRAVEEDLRSRSHALTPDIILGYRGRLLILDAKFKAYVDAIGAFSDATLFPDLQQMHTYRDAVVGPGGQGGAVSGAWLLFCGGGASVGPEVVAFPESTAAEPFGDGLIGALRLRPGHAAGTARLCALLRGFLSERS